MPHNDSKGISLDIKDSNITYQKTFIRKGLSKELH
jgi:hypothetical protein